MALGRGGRREEVHGLQETVPPQVHLGSELQDIPPLPHPLPTHAERRRRAI